MNSRFSEPQPDALTTMLQPPKMFLIVPSRIIRQMNLDLIIQISTVLTGAIIAKTYLFYNVVYV